MHQYNYYYNMYMDARRAYEKEKADYRHFANTENQIGKKEYTPPLTLNPQNVILKSHAEKCKAAHEYLKHRQRLFEHFRKKMEKTLRENGLVIWYEHGKQN